MVIFPLAPDQTIAQCGQMELEGMVGSNRTAISSDYSQFLLRDMVTPNSPGVLSRMGWIL